MFRDHNIIQNVSAEREDMPYRIKAKGNGRGGLRWGLAAMEGAKAATAELETDGDGDSVQYEEANESADVPGG